MTNKRVIVVVEILLGILILGGALAALSGPKNPGLVVSVLVLVVIFFAVLKRLSKMP
jgi:hypothetical protein